MNIKTVLWYEYQIFRSRFWSQTASHLISPTLYLIAFGWGLGDKMSVNGMPYIQFVIPGIIAMTTMTTSFGSVANNLNVSRIYDKVFEEFMTAPIRTWEYTVGKVLGGALRGLYAATLILLLSFVFRASLSINLSFIVLIILNALVFSALGFVIGMVIESHLDMSRFNSFIILPMSFFCGTFFPIEKMPAFLQPIIRILPLTITTTGVRDQSAWSAQMVLRPTILLLYVLIFLWLGIRLCRKAE